MTKWVIGIHRYDSESRVKGSHIGLAMIGVVAAGLIYARVSRFDRLASRATTTTVTAEEWDVLKQHPDDPRVIAAAALEVREASTLADCDSVGRAALRAGPVLEAHPTSDDESLAAIARMVGTCADVRSARWTARPPEDLVKALHKDLAHASALPKNVLIDALVRMAPRMSQDLVDVIVAQVRPDSGTAETLVATGLPPNGDRLASASASVTREPALSDARVPAAIRTWLGAMKEAGPTEADAKALLRAIAWSLPTQLTDEMAEAIGKSIAKTPAVRELCTKLVRVPNDAEVLKKHASGEAVDACAAPGLQMKAALDLLYGTAAAATQFEDEKGEAGKKKRDAWEDAQAETIAKLGPSALAAAREGLKHNARTTRRVSARTFAKLDRSGYGTTIAERIHNHSANADDAKLAIELVTKDGGFDARVVLAAFYTGDIDSVKRATAALKAAKPELWVEPLFADISVVTASSPSVIYGYNAALGQAAGAAALAATSLDRAITRAGRADAVFWVTKYLALNALKAKGVAANAPLVEKFTSDKTSYPVIKYRSESLTGELVEESRTTKTIGELATATLTAVKGR